MQVERSEVNKEDPDNQIEESETTTNKEFSKVNIIENTSGSVVLLKYAILSFICILAFSSRLYSIANYESVIHEFDPYFNFKTTKYLVEEGYYNFLNWFDASVWYPLGRNVGGTVYPGLMITAAFIHKVLNTLSFTVNIRNICVLTAPLFSSFSSIVTYLITTETYKSTGAGLVAALLMSIIPGYMARSVAGSYDNEAVAIFAMIVTFYFWVKSVNTGSIKIATICSLCYLYMISSWGGYVYVLNLIALHTVILILMGRYSQRLYISYSIFYTLGMIFSLHIRFVGFQAVYSSEHISSTGVFGLLQLFAFHKWLKTIIDEKSLYRLSKSVIFFGILSILSVLFIGQFTGIISPWTGRLYSFIDPSYAKKYIPIVASVSEHQPTPYPKMFFTFHILTLILPFGAYLCFKKISDSTIFLILYIVTSLYFSSIMIRLLLVLSPIFCILAGIGISETLNRFLGDVKSSPSAKKYSSIQSILVIFSIIGLLYFYSLHCHWIAKDVYSNPSIIISTYSHTGERVLLDDYREAYWWINMNTAPDAKIMSWWDYGYQISAMGNRSTLVDNNTWNNSHIAEVGTAMASNEEDAIKLVRKYDVDYVLVVFGGFLGYSHDDINKFIWMVRIGGSTHPEIVERDYFNNKNQYSVSYDGAPKLLESLMYKLSYFNYWKVVKRGQKGFDLARGSVIGNQDYSLKYFEEAFTSENWLVRIFKVKDKENKG